MPFKELKFCYNWRSYQDRFLVHFQSHIQDNHLHVIAPPGSGKTILGIELMRKINKKSLVLCPTLTIRNQWHDRLQTFFMDGNSFDEFSFDISNPSNVTFSTYQSLHSFYKKCTSKEEYFSFFQQHRIEVLILDECHHLKNEWWKCLYELKEKHQQTVVALTATPPYDSEALEVNKYFKLCGEIDDEIVVPDLVKEGDLCPHQDFVYFSEPSKKEIEFIIEYRMKIAAFFDAMSTNESLINFLKNHRFLKDTHKNLNDIYANPEYLSSILIFLNHCKITLDKNYFYILGFEKNESVKIPDFDLPWAQILLQNLLINDRKNLEQQEHLLQTTEQEVRRIHALENNSVDFVGTKTLYRSLSNSISKLESILSILKSENTNLKSDLRAVVLTDYIKKEFLDIEETDRHNINRLGVIPIFYRLKNELPKNSIAVLSGSVVIVHKSLQHFLDESIRFSVLKTDEDYISLTIGSHSDKIVKTITQFFEEGKITILIGTKSLLGEGWDAPSINTLILASFVGSFVSSNQMRGRAIRTTKNNSDKTGNIWHLVCLDPTDNKGGKDVETLKRRFDSYVGISNDDHAYIESGIDRLNLPFRYDNFDLDEFNRRTLSLSNQRAQMKKKWYNAIRLGSSLSREIKQYYPEEKPFQLEKEQRFKDVVKYSVVELTVAISLFLPEFLLKNLNVIITKGLLAFTYSLLTALGLTFGVKSYKAIRAYVQFGFLHKDIKKISQALLDSMCEIGFISTTKNNIFLNSFINPKGDVIVSIKGVADFESGLFIRALEQILAPIQNPRYLVIKTNWFRKNFEVENYYSVPDILGDKKKNCRIFEKHWRQTVGESRFYYTRHLEGRKLLLKARMFHISNVFKETTKKAVIWN
ncbi:DEAD/DEAH box helicase family protein [Flavobacterium sp. U410]